MDDATAKSSRAQPAEDPFRPSKAPTVFIELAALAEQYPRDDGGAQPSLGTRPAIAPRSLHTVKQVTGPRSRPQR